MHFYLIVYIGENASLSFLDFLRHSLKQLVGATAFTDAQPQNLNLMLDSDVEQDTNPGISLDMEDKKALFDSYAAIVRLTVYSSTWCSVRRDWN